MCYSVPSIEILLILWYQHITRLVKQYLTCKHNILEARHCKGGHIMMTTITKIDLTFATQLAYPVIIEISGQQGSSTQHLYELLSQLHCQ